MPTRDEELEEFKTRINLTEYMATCGYALDRRASSRNSVVMRHPNGEKIVIGRGHDQHWVFFSVHDGSSGSIIDFAMNNKGLNLGQARRELRPWTGTAAVELATRPAAGMFAERVEPITRDAIGVRAKYEAAVPLVDGQSPYLTGTRGIPAALLADEKLVDRVRVDGRGNVLFPHFDRNGICGYEVKNYRFTGFAPGGIKGLWGGRKLPNDSTLAIAETAIDALSYVTLNGHERTRFLSIAGNMNPEPQPDLIAAAIRGMPAGSRIVAAVDNDAGGHSIAQTLRGIFDQVGRDDLAFQLDVPAAAGADWNDVLRGRGTENPSPSPSA